MRIDGKKISQEILDDLREKIKNLQKTPFLIIIQIGDDPASNVYVKQKVLKATEIGAKNQVINLSKNITPKELIEIIEKYNKDEKVDGIIIQRPLPKNIDPEIITNAVIPEKDIDGLRSDSKFEMPLGLAVLRILKEIFELKSQIQSTKFQINSNTQNTNTKKGVDFENSNFGIISDLEFRYSNFFSWLKSKKIIVIGKGRTGGGPVIDILKKYVANIEVIDSKTQSPDEITQNADIIISAVGKDRIINRENIKKGVILISIGMHKGKEGKLHGDYEEDEIKQITSFYTPTPGGVGPVNVSMLLKNLVDR